jgi:iron(III) transport system permease protein
MGNENTAIQLACLLIFLVFTILFIEKLSYKKSRFYYSANSKIEKLSTPGANKYVYIYGLCSLPFILGFLVPFFYILNNSIINIKNIDFSRLFELSLNSIQVSTISTILIIITALLFLYVEKISKLKFNTFISQVTSLGYVIPGAVIGLGVILLFTKVPMLNSFSLVGSFYVLIYAYVFRFLAVGKSPIKSSLEKQPDSYDDTAKTLGLGPFKILQKIHFPINRLALITAFIVTFVDLLKELPITLILRPFNFDTLATQTYEFAIEEMMVESSSYSLAIILIGSVMLVFLKYIINKQINAS